MKKIKLFSLLVVTMLTFVTLAGCGKPSKSETIDSIILAINNVTEYSADYTVTKNETNTGTIKIDLEEDAYEYTFDTYGSTGTLLNDRLYFDGRVKIEYSEEVLTHLEDMVRLGIDPSVFKTVAIEDSLKVEGNEKESYEVSFDLDPILIRDYTISTMSPELYDAMYTELAEYGVVFEEGSSIYSKWTYTFIIDPVTHLPTSYTVTLVETEELGSDTATLVINNIDCVTPVEITV